MKGGLYLILVGLFMVSLPFSCTTEPQEKVMHDVVIEIVHKDNVIDTVNYYALLNEKKIMEFSEVDAECLIVSIYADSTKQIEMSKVLDCNVHSFEILSYKKSKSKITQIKID